MVIFAGGKFCENVANTFHIGVIFAITSQIFWIKAYMFYFRVGEIFAKKTISWKMRKLPHAKISTFTVKQDCFGCTQFHIVGDDLFHAVYEIRDGLNMPVYVSGVQGDTPRGYKNWTDLMIRAIPAGISPSVRAGRTILSPCIYIYTSGTTGTINTSNQFMPYITVCLSLCLSLFVCLFLFVC